MKNVSSNQHDKNRIATVNSCFTLLGLGARHHRVAEQLVASPTMSHLTERLEELEARGKKEPARRLIIG